MKKLAIAATAVALMSLAACGETPEAEANNAANEVMVNSMESSANAMDNAANAMAETANTMNNAAQ